MIRIDRFLTLYVSRPLLLSVGGAAILMYHSISEGHQSVHPYHRTLTSPGVFAGQMRFLHENGYNVIDLAKLVENLNAHREPVQRSVALTFDDGFQDFYTNAFPVLRKYGFTATVFLATGYIGTPRTKFKGRPCLDWSEVSALSQNGISFGSHTHSHPKLTSLSRKQIENELTVSKDIIENMTGRPVYSFSYPYSFPQAQGSFIRLLRATLIDKGYKFCVTTRIGLNSSGCDNLTLKRIPVNTEDDLMLFQAKLEGAYEWVYKLQCVYKHFLSILGRRKTEDERWRMEV